MKKYVTGLFSIALALVLFSFTSREVKPSKAMSTPYFWYEYDASTDQLGALLNPNSSIKIVKEAVETDCADDLGQPECVRAYDENTRANELHPPTPLDVIKETDESKR